MFSQFDGARESFQLDLKGFEVTATAQVSAYTDARGLNRLFQELASFERPWQGQKTWASIEGDFSITANCTALGNVTFFVELCGLQGGPEAWKVEVGLVSEFGQLEKIAHDSDLFFNSHN